MEETTRAVEFTGGDELFRLKSGELIQVEWYAVTPKEWHADERSEDKAWHVRSVSPRLVLAFRVTG